MRIRWKRPALLDFFRIKDHIAKHNPAAAEQVGSEIQNAAFLLKSFPQLGHGGERIGIFELQVPNRPYVLPYRLNGEVIEILAVFDQRRNPKDRA
ncbi:MAG: type II toxin-antitoxin system RelE/ParE family toxin [Aestuariivirga sp.]